eukprot:XP_027322987.1 atherin-like [Anas platyrhynchos]
MLCLLLCPSAEQLRRGARAPAPQRLTPASVRLGVLCPPPRRSRACHGPGPPDSLVSHGDTLRSPGQPCGAQPRARERSEALSKLRNTKPSPPSPLRALRLSQHGAPRGPAPSPPPGRPSAAATRRRAGPCRVPPSAEPRRAPPKPRAAAPAGEEEEEEEEEQEERPVLPRRPLLFRRPQVRAGPGGGSRKVRPPVTPAEWEQRQRGTGGERLKERNLRVTAPRRAPWGCSGAEPLGPAELCPERGAGSPQAGERGEVSAPPALRPARRASAVLVLLFLMVRGL